MFGNHLFEIPIYPDAEDTFYAKTDKLIEQKYQQFIDENNVAKSRLDSVKNSFDAKYRSGGWRYNRAIGWIELFSFGTPNCPHIKAEYSFIEEIRITIRTRNKPVFYQGEAFELSPDPTDSSHTIYKALCQEFEDLQEEDPFKGRYLDLKAFHTIGEFVNWKKLLKQKGFLS